MTEFIGGPGAGPDSSYPRWMFNTHGTPCPWTWDDGPPRLRELQPCRAIIARALSKHLPASPYSTTTKTLVPVESGLEADLLRSVDRDPKVAWIVSQPLTLLWHGQLKHTPDLLTLGADGAVTVWDVRPSSRQNDRFLRVARMTEDACEHVGWQYQVFSDENPIRRLNIQWLTHHRSLPWWGDHIIDDVLAELGAGPRTIDKIVEAGGNAAERLRVVWHLVWSGRITTDLDVRLDGGSALSLPSLA